MRCVAYLRNKIPRTQQNPDAVLGNRSQILRPAPRSDLRLSHPCASPRDGLSPPAVPCRRFAPARPAADSGLRAMAMAGDPIRHPRHPAAAARAPQSPPSDALLHAPASRRISFRCRRLAIRDDQQSRLTPGFSEGHKASGPAQSERNFAAPGGGAAGQGVISGTSLSAASLCAHGAPGGMQNESGGRIQAGRELAE